MAIEHFASRHIGPDTDALDHMLKTVGVKSMDELIDLTIPSAIRLDRSLNLPAGLTEQDYLKLIKEKGSKNKVFRSYIGMGYHPTFIPPVIQRNVLENPGWYTAYTPYQAEIAQGRLEALLAFQTMVSDLTGMDLANASLLDEGTAAAEAMLMFYNTRSRTQKKSDVRKCFIDEQVFVQTIDVLKTRAIPMGIELVIGDYQDFEDSDEYFAAIVQYPNAKGSIEDYEGFIKRMAAQEIRTAVGSDLMALALVKPPGHWGADVVFGNSQRFGVPMGYGGPHAAFFATRDSFKRNIPGRIIGVSKDRFGRPAFRMALQTREQHIRRDKATSNICTAQALLAVMAGMYAVYHGPEGIRQISLRIHQQTMALEKTLREAGVEVTNQNFYDTLSIKPSNDPSEIRNRAEAMGINLRYDSDGEIGISLNELTTEDDLKDLASVFKANWNKKPDYDEESHALQEFIRSDKYLSHEVFNSYRSETDMMRYLKKLENRDLSLTHSMIPLGSCTMKLNAASELMPITWSEFSSIHPFAPIDQAEGYTEVIIELGDWLTEITGFAGVSMQPNSGAQGEYSGLMVIRAYHESQGDHHRNICLIPSSAHGTNPASAVMAGMQVVVVQCDDQGNVDIDDLKEKAIAHKENLAALMVTYPSTHGVFEAGIREITGIVHENGGQVYMDGANMNAQVGLTNPGNIGADVCHLNLHKTFAIPHGGGGPGMGPIGVAKHLLPFLPGNPVIKTGGEQAITAISSAPFGSALILLISYAYVKMLGAGGLTASTEYAILNANYLKARLKGHYDILYTATNGTVAHEMIIDCRAFKKFGIEVEDIAKRLMDYGFHAPTVSFPVAGTMMIEPTESESLSELDRFAEAMLSIRKEIEEVESGQADAKDNLLKMAPHTAYELCANEWKHPYSRERSAYPLSYLRESKFWVSVGRVDSAYGDRHLMCTCPPMEMYEEQL